MEPMSGFDLLEQVRSDERLAYIRFVMVSAEPLSCRVTAAKNANADSFIVKPFSARTLMAKLKRLLPTKRCLVVLMLLRFRLVCFANVDWLPAR